MVFCRLLTTFIFESWESWERSEELEESLEDVLEGADEDCDRPELDDDFEEPLLFFFLASFSSFFTLSISRLIYRISSS